MNLWLLCWLPSLLYVLAACCRLAILARRNRPRPSVAAPVVDDPLTCEICSRPYAVVAFGPPSESPRRVVRLCGGCVADDAGVVIREKGNVP